MKFTYTSGATPLPGYTIKRAIHRGGFGEVYYGVSQGGKEVALKLLMENRDVELRGIQQCLNLQHPHLVSLYDVRLDPDGDAWVIMEYIDGATLSEVLARNPNGLPKADVARWLSGIVEGVEFLHNSGIIHRDLKPANLFDHQGQIKVGDVGLSKLMTPTKRSAHTQSVGTVYYMAPEIAQGKYGKEVDTYAIGVIAYELLTGKVPFDGQTTAEILMKHMTSEPDYSVIPIEYRDVIKQALVKDPAQRLVNLKDFLIDQNGPQQTAISARQPYAWKSERDQRTTANCGTQQNSHNQAVTECGPPAWLKKFWVMLGIAGLFLLIARGGMGSTVMFSSVANWSRLSVLLLVMAAGYLIYKLSPAGLPWLVSPSAEPVPSSPPVIGPPRVRPHDDLQKPKPQRSIRLLDPHTIRHISLGDRVGQVSYSSLIAIPMTALFSVVCVMFRPDAFTTFLGNGPDPGLIALFAGSILIGSCLMILAGKLIEGLDWDMFSRRLLFAVVGIGTGLLIHQWSGFLLTDLQTTDAVDGILDHVGGRPLLEFGSSSTNPLASHPSPSALGFAIYFGTVFMITSWWKWTDSFRRNRISPGVLLWCGFLAWLCSKVVAFPSGWGMVIVFGIACVVQTSAVWIRHTKRRELLSR